MKVLHLISGGDSGGAKTHVFSLLGELKNQIDVKIVCLTAGVFYQEILDKDIPVELFLQKHRYDLRVIKKLMALIKNEGYEILHAHGARANFVASILKRFVKIPVVTTVHSDYLLDFEGNIYRKVVYTGLNVVALKSLDYYIGVSNSFRDMLVSRGFPEDKVFTVYNGIDFDEKITYGTREQFLSSMNLKVNPDELLVGIIGRFDKVKGHEIFIKAAAEVVKYVSNVTFILAGDGSEKEHLKQLATQLGIHDKVIFAGFVDQIYDFIEAIDINTLTSYSESFPYVLLEGARLKKPTVSSAVGGIPDLITDGENGFLFESGNYHELAEKLIQLIHDKELRNRFGEKLYERASRNFSNKNLAQSHVVIYEQILQRQKEHSKENDVVISGYYGFKNSGDDAILMAIVNNLRALKPNIRISVLSMNPKETRRIYGVDSINRFNFFAIYKLLKNSKLFINGGGSLLQDITSTRSLMYYLGTIRLALKLNKKVMIYANGIGPIHKKKNEKAVRDVVNQVDLITLREEASFHEIKRLKIDKPPVLVTADPALTLQPVDEIRIQEIFRQEGIPTGKPIVCVSIRSWKKKSQYSEVIAKMCDYIIEKYGADILFIPMHFPRDIWMIHSIVLKMKEKPYVLKGKYSVDELLGVIKKCDLMIGMRLHALIYAATLGVPMIGLAYEAKVQAFLNYIGQITAGDITNIKFEHLCRVIDDVWPRRQEIALQLQEIIHELKEKAMENARLAVKLLEDSIN